MQDANPLGQRMMSETDRLMALITDIYDAALDVSKWASVLADVARFVGGPAAAIHSKVLPERSSRIHFQHGINASFERLYVAEFAKIDPSTGSQLAAEVGDIVSAETHLSYVDFKEGRFYKEWAYPQGLVDGATAILHKTPTAVAMLTVFRHQHDGLVDEDMRERMRSLVPHVRRAIRIGKLLDRSQSQTNAFADALDGLNAAVFFIDAAGHLVHANAAARTMLSRGDVLAAPNGRLLTRKPAIDGMLREVLAAALSGEDSAEGKSVALSVTTRNGEDENYVVHVLPLASPARRRHGSAATTALFVSKAGLTTPSSPELIRQHYKLTPTELRVALAICEIGGVPEVAGALGVSTTTVKTHLDGVYRKTGTNRQADLVRLVAGFASPIGPIDCDARATLKSRAQISCGRSNRTCERSETFPGHAAR
jgi:DNA-binding CsgD family transcriptional regulator/PAS domain-containing protein